MRKLKRRLLRKIPLEELNDLDIQSYINGRKVDLFGYAEKERNQTYYIKAKIEEVENENVLVLSFFETSPPEGKPFFVVFVSEEDFISLATKEDKWLTGRINNNEILKKIWSGYDYEISCNVGNMVLSEYSNQRIRNFISSINNSPIEEGKEMRAVVLHQNRITQNRLLTKHEKITKAIDEKMAPVSELPDVFNQWVEETALYFSRYIFYNYTGKKIMSGVCTHCNNEVDIERPKHNQKGICPSCNSPVIYKSFKKQRTIEDKTNATILERIDQEILQRRFSVRKKYEILQESDTERFRTKIFIYETERDFIPAKTESNIKKFSVEEYVWEYFKQTGKLRWCHKEYGKYGGWSSSSDYSYGALYTGNIEEVLKDSLYEYSGIKIIAESSPGYSFNIDGYLVASIKYPWIEYLCKQGMFRLAAIIAFKAGRYSDYVTSTFGGDININGRTPEDIFQITKEDFLLLKNINGNAEDMNLLKHLKKEGLRIKEEQLKYISENDLNRHYRLFNCKYSSLSKLLKYLRQQKRKHKRVKLSNICTDYLDYISFCEKLKKDLSNLYYLFPPDLIRAHDEAHEELKAAEDKKKQTEKRRNSNKIKRMSKSLKEKFEMSYKGFCIKVPESIKEIEKEGEVLHHCVGSYAERMAKGQTTILFVRKSKETEKPFFTLEVGNNDIRQCRGEHNKSYESNPGLKAFINKFKNTKLMQQAKSKAI